ncbi:hypothetical protein E2553_40125 [Paraburkholderia dipogonis]|uniref:Uncharacterized protein n=1 Tax=Paraburkholderia dipogonis TaxID=1211383 RepID=A0A4Y8MJQ0_9BURK|nr:hypothetical protein [Paraburkholderia dipogonis]TFE37624.1 hypothetical protein E2553_40125 [Paraburkholderia dipogonis]
MFALQETCIDDREAATNIHKKLREQGAPLLVMGKFYLSVLVRGVWPSQRAIASDLDVSLSQMSRMVATARLPEAVLRLFIGQPLSFREADTLRRLSAQLGETEIVRRTQYVSEDCSLEDVFAILTIGHPKERKGVRLSLVHGQKYLRLDVPNFEQVATRVAHLEQILNLLLTTSDGKDWMPAMPLTGKRGV